MNRRDRFFMHTLPVLIGMLMLAALIFTVGYLFVDTLANNYRPQP